MLLLWLGNKLQPGLRPRLQGVLRAASKRGLLGTAEVAPLGNLPGFSCSIWQGGCTLPAVTMLGQFSVAEGLVEEHSLGWSQRVYVQTGLRGSRVRHLRPVEEDRTQGNLLFPSLPLGLVSFPLTPPSTLPPNLARFSKFPG